MGMTISKTFDDMFGKCGCGNGIRYSGMRAYRCTECPGTGNKKSKPLTIEKEAELIERIRKYNEEIFNKFSY